MIKKLLLTLTAFMLLFAFSVSTTGCSATDYGKQISANWGIGDTDETFTYDVLMDNMLYGNFTTTVRKIYKAEDIEVKTIENGAVSTKNISVKEGYSIITGKTDFNPSGELGGDNLEYISIVDKLLRPVYTFKTLIADKYNAMHANNENYTAAVNYAYSIDYSYDNYDFSKATYAYLEQDKDVKTGEITTDAKYFFDNDSLIFVLRSLPIANMSSSFSYSIFNVKDGTSTALYSSFTPKQSLSDIPYFNNEAVSAISCNISLSQDIAGKSIKVFYSNEDITNEFEYNDNGTQKIKEVVISKAPVKIIESTMTYVLRIVDATPRP